MDGSGRPLAGAKVTAQSPSAAIPPTTATTDDHGRYRIPLLPPREDYRIVAEAEGYEPVSLDPVALPPGRATRLDLTLVPGAAAGGPAEGADRPALVSVGHTATDTVFEASFVDGLPLLGRTYQDVLTLAPGVTDVDGGGDPNVNGARAREAQARLDGAPGTDPSSGAAGLSGNLESFATVQVISTGAPAPFGGAQGGFVNLLTRSGGDKLSGAFKLFYRSDALDGDGAGNTDGGEPLVAPESFDAVQPFFEIGGPIIRDRLWYFLALEHLSADVSGVPALGAREVERSDRGWSNFLRFGWQVAPAHGLAFELAQDALDSEGLGIDPLTDPRSGVELAEDSLQGTVRWDWAARPGFLLETLASGYRATFDGTPSAEPAPCPVDATGSCNPFREDLYSVDLIRGTITGPHFQRVSLEQQRLALRSDATWFLDSGRGGDHTVRAGIEAIGEEIDASIRQDSVRFDAVSGGPFGPTGTITFLEPLGPQPDASATSDRLGLYAEDDYKPLPNLSIRLGVRYDVEDLEADGYTAFDPAADAERFLDRYAVGVGTGINPATGEPWTLTEALASGRVIFDVNGDGLDMLHCSFYDLDGSAFGDGMPDGQFDDFWTYYDGDGDGIVDPDNPLDFVQMSPDGIPDGSFRNPACDRSREDVFFLVSAFTRHQFDDLATPLSAIGGPGAPLPGIQRQAEPIVIDQDHVSPRVSVAWDPWRDGRTQFFGTWGRYYGAIPPGALLLETEPDVRAFVFDAADAALGAAAVPEAVGQISTFVVDRDLETPFTDEWTIGVQRELGVAWRLGLVYVDREAEDQLQDVEVNHYVQDLDGDGLLDDDLGAVGPFGSRLPDGLPDLFVFNPLFAEVWAIGSVNRSEYESFQVEVVRPLRGRWQMTASYVYSQAKGDAEEILSPVGDDAGVQGAEFSSLDYDATHAVKVSALGHLPWRQTLGGIVRWSSGLPFTLIEHPVSLDSFGNAQVRTIYPTGSRNSERNEGTWQVDLAYRKLFPLGRIQAGFGIEVFNLLDSDDLYVAAVNRVDGFGTEMIRSFGRRWQLSAQVTF